MINMKESPKGATLLAESTEVDTPEYPYGLRIRLESEQMDKLGLGDTPEVGTVLTLTARVVVESFSQSDYGKGEHHRDMGLQITDMELKPEGGKPSGQSLYPNSNMT